MTLINKLSKNAWLFKEKGGRRKAEMGKWACFRLPTSDFPLLASQPGRSWIAYAKPLLWWVLFFFPLCSFAQVQQYRNVLVVVQEKAGGTIRPLPGARLRVSDQGEVQADNSGRYRFRYPIRNGVEPQIDISLVSDSYKVLKPLDRSIALDTTCEETLIDFLVVNTAEESAVFLKKIRDLETRISRLRARNELTNQQLNALKSKLVDTLIYFEANRAALEGEIGRLTEESDEVRSENEALRAKLADMEEEVGQLTDQLQEALEERYLRQNQHFKVLSKNLMEFLQRAKDVRDELPFIKEYYNSAGGFRGYQEKLNQYERVFTEINTSQENYLEGVERYWDDKTQVRELEKVLQYLLEGVHLKQIRPVVNNVNEELRKQKPNNAQKIATVHFEVLDVNIRTLEKDVARILQRLRTSL